MNIQLPEWADFLFEPARYKVAHGGRGSGKSHSFAKALLIQAAQQPLRVLCAREIQKSIKDSVHALLADQIQFLGLESAYTVLETEIRGINGSRFFFTGLQQHTVTSIKSIENVDRCWVEEAQTVSEKSWDILLPTIRAPGSEVWLTLNPVLDTDSTYQRFIAKPSANSVVVEVNYTSNPWFSAELEAERQETLRLNPTNYDHIWLGKCRPAVEGAIYHSAMVGVEKRVGNVPHDAALKTHAVWDLGFADDMAIILVQKAGSEIRFIHHIEGNQRTLADYSAELRALTLDDQPINWGNHYLPHDGFAVKHQTGKSDAEVMGKLGWNVRRVPSIDVEAGINRVREMLPRVWFNRERTAKLIDHLRRYRRSINREGHPGLPVHDAASHTADATRYVALSVDDMTNDEWGGSLNYPRLTVA